MLKNIVKQFTQRQAHPLIQFVKYGLTGVAQVILDALIFALLGWKIFPALRADEWVVRFFHLPLPVLTEPQRAWNFAVCKALSFVVVTYFGYVVNVKWVFEPGRHTPLKELWLFYGISLTTFLAGTCLGAWTIQAHGYGGLPAFVLGTSFAVVCNYLIRKYYIFKH